MSESDRKFWPYKPRASLVSAIVLLMCLLLTVAILRSTIKWPSETSEAAVFIGVLAFSLLPILLAVVDIIIERGGVIEYGGVKIDFSRVSQAGMSDIAMPVNIGLPNQPVDSSSMPDILGALRDAVSCDVVIIDLGNGKAWWETRLLVLLAGAVRQKKPGKVVFIGKDGGVDKCFQGWGHPHELLPLLLQTDSQYELSYNKALTEARRAELIEYMNPAAPAGPEVEPNLPDWMKGGVSNKYNVQAFNEKGLPNQLFPEKFLAYDLAAEVERNEDVHKTINLARLEELFRSVLYRKSIDESWPSEQQMTAFFESNSEYFAVTHNSKYTTLVSRLTVLNTIVRKLVELKRKI